MKNFALFIRLFMLVASVSLLACNGGQTKKIVPALNLSYIDSTVNPGDDFFRFANGRWLDSIPIPDDKTRWGEFNILHEQSNEHILSIIKEISKDANVKKGSNKYKIKEFYNTGMDTVTIDKLGVSPLNDLFKKISSIKTKEDVQNVSAYLHTLDISTFFTVYAGPDKKNSSMNIANIDQGGLGLPNREYYLSDKEHFKKLRDAYVKHVAKMFTLLGDDDATAKANAKTIMLIETDLAKASFTMLQLRDAGLNYNMLTVDELSKASPEINWVNYFTKMGYPNITSVNVSQLPFIEKLSTILKETEVGDWKTFFRWKLINSTASYLSSDFENADFNFYSATMSGQKQMSPRWKRVLGKTSSTLGEAIGEIYVQKYFPPEAKKKMLALVQNLRVALAKRIDNLTWMGDATKKAAKEKLDAFTVKVGYPDEWKDYSALKVGTTSYVTNVLNGRNFAFKFNMDKVGKPVNKKEWGMTPQTANAYYSPSTNEIVFPAGILQPPFFNLHADDAVNYGGIGVVIGHEMSHGFDDQGSKYDKDGNMKNWWAKEDRKRYNEQTQKLVEHFDGFVAIDSFHVNGKLTLGENIGDFGGLTIAYEALKIAKKGDLSEKIDGFTLSQRFFLSYAAIWRSNIRDEALKRNLKEDVHSPARFRVNGGLFNIPEFYEAFNIKKTDKLYRPVEKRPVIW